MVIRWEVRDPFVPYEGKIIRKIFVNQIGFQRTVQDTTRRVKSIMAHVANRLHNDTKEWVVRDNIFLREGKPLNPYRASYNRLGQGLQWKAPPIVIGGLATESPAPCMCAGVVRIGGPPVLPEFFILWS